MEKERNTYPISDAINCSITKEFIQAPLTHKLLQNPDISGKAKALLCLLLSNKEGWEHTEEVTQMMKEGPTAIQSAIRELRHHKYLKRIQYRDSQTKRWAGSFWIYTDIPNQFIINNYLKTLKSKGMEIY